MEDVIDNRTESVMQAASSHKKSGSRMANLELLRCIAMMMVVVLHYLGKGEILPDLTGPGMNVTGAAAWLLESFCIVAVNVYMLISGYFLSTSSFKLSRLVKLYLQVWVYSVGIGALSMITGVMPAQEVTVHDLLTMVLPVSMGHYWFLSAYIFMYAFLPFMGGAVQKLSRKQMQVALGGLLLFFCVLKSVLPVRLELDNLGYDCIWYLCVFLTAAYIRRFGVGVFDKLRNSILLYVGSGLGIFGLTFALYGIYLKTGSLGRIVKIGLEYNHILPYLAAIGLFGIFLHVKPCPKMSVVICKIAPYTLGVYLLHENIGLRYAWQSRLGADRIGNVAGLIVWTLIAVLVVFAAGILLDMLRAAVMKGLHKLLMKLGLYRKLVGGVEAADRLFTTEAANTAAEAEACGYEKGQK